MDDGELNSSVRIDGFNGVWKTLQAINASNQDALHATVPPFGNGLQPELGAFGLGNPEAKHFFLACQVDPNGQIDGFDPYRAVAHFDVNTIEIEDGVQGIQRA